MRLRSATAAAIAAAAAGSVSVSAPVSSSTPSSTPPSTTSSSSATSSLSAGLLTVSDLGTGYQQDPPDNSPESRLPCTPDKPPLFTQLPPQTRVQTNFSGTTEQVGIAEDLAVFTDLSDAKQAVTVSELGFGCKTGSLDGQTVTFTGSGKVTVTGTTVDSDEGWDFRTTQFKGTAILMRIGNKFLGLVLSAAPTAGNNVNIQAIVNAAARRAAAVG